MNFLFIYPISLRVPSKKFLEEFTYLFLERGEGKEKVFIFRERGRKGEREGEKHHCVLASRTPPPGDQACNPGVCPAWELNQ